MAAVRAFVLSGLARTALLLFWSLAGWGALLLLSASLATAREGPRALGRVLLPAHASFWAWLNAFSATLALGVGLCAAGLVAWSLWSGRVGEPPAS